MTVAHHHAIGFSIVVVAAAVALELASSMDVVDATMTAVYENSIGIVEQWMLAMQIDRSTAGYPL
jgi:hypothetical protein